MRDAGMYKVVDILNMNKGYQDAYFDGRSTFTMPDGEEISQLNRLVSVDSFEVHEILSRGFDDSDAHCDDDGGGMDCLGWIGAIWLTAFCGVLIFWDEVLTLAMELLH